MRNTKLNPAYIVPNASEFEKKFGAYVQLESGVGDLKEGLWADVVARVCKEGVSADAGEMLARLAEFEAIAQTVGGPDGPVTRKRAPRKGVADTGYVTPDTFKTYKSIIKRAVTADVELLDDDGVPRSVASVLTDLEEAKAEKTPIEKLRIATDTWLKILANCDPSDKADAVNLAQAISDAAAAFAS